MSNDELTALNQDLRRAMRRAGVAPDGIQLVRKSYSHDFGWRNYLLVNGAAPLATKRRAAAWLAKRLTANGFTYIAAGEGFAQIETTPKVTGRARTAVCIGEFCDMW